VCANVPNGLVTYNARNSLEDNAVSLRGKHGRKAGGRCLVGDQTQRSVGTKGGQQRRLQSLTCSMVLDEVLELRLLFA